MKQIIACLLLVALVRPGFSQNIYTKFLERSSVSWAMDATDTIRFVNPNLSLQVREKLNAGKIKAAITEPGSSTVTEIKFVKKQNIIRAIAPNSSTQIMDAAGNLTDSITGESPLLSSKYFDEGTGNLMEAAQIFYIQSGRLRSYIPWVSAKYAITTSWGERLGIANAFSTSFRKCRGFSGRSKRKSVSLGTATRTLILDANGNDKTLKQLYGQNLVQALWPHLGSKYYELRRPGTNETLTLPQINQTLIEESPMPVPVYDEEGKLTSKQIILQESQPLDLSKITRVELVQNWYYNNRKNELYSTIKELMLFAVRSKSGVADGAALPVLRILVK